MQGWALSFCPGQQAGPGRAVCVGGGAAGAGGGVPYRGTHSTEPAAVHMPALALPAA